MLNAFIAALQQYDKDLVGQDSHLPLSSVFRISNCLGEGVFASADNWIKSINCPNFGGVNVEAYCKLQNQPMGFLVDWAQRHPVLLPHLAA